MEKKNPYYMFLEDEKVMNRILEEFGLDVRKIAYHQWSRAG